MTTLSSLRSGIKSIQQGTITVANASASNTATISSVDTAKAVVMYGGHTATSNGVAASMARCTLTNATTVTVDRAAGFLTNPVIFNYTVVEFS
jgi:sulfite reductase alpha subunit-like flavoprotein